MLRRMWQMARCRVGLHGDVRPGRNRELVNGVEVMSEALWCQNCGRRVHRRR